MANNKIREAVETLHMLAAKPPYAEFGGLEYDSEESIEEDFACGLITPCERDALIAGLKANAETNAKAVTLITSALNLLEAVDL